MQYIANDLRKIIENEKDVALYLSSISAQDFIKDIQSILTKNEILRKLPKKSIEERKLDFRDELAKYLEVYGRDMLNQFFKYWTEANTGKTRMKFEMEKTWQMNLRLERWDKSTNKKTPEQPTIHLKENPRN